MPTPIVVNIPLTTFAPGTQTLGPAVVGTGYGLARVVVDRTVGTAPWNSAASTTQMVLHVWFSFDGGTTFNEAASSTIVGGTYIDNETGLTVTQSVIAVPLPQPSSTTRQAKASIILSGASVSFSGSFTVS